MMGPTYPITPVHQNEAVHGRAHAHVSISLPFGSGSAYTTLKLVSNPGVHSRVGYRLKPPLLSIFITEPLFG